MFLFSKKNLLCLAARVCKSKLPCLHFISSYYQLQPYFRYLNLYRKEKKINFLKTNCSADRFFTLKNIESHCWKCDKTIESQLKFCTECNAIQKPSEDMNYFHLLSVEQSFDVVEEHLASNYKALQRILHPDKYTLKLEEEQLIAEEYSSLVNKAYSTLRNPWLRGRYLLSFSGIDIDEGTSVDDPQLLINVMDRNEELNDCQSLEDVFKVRNENTSDLLLAINAVSRSFKEKNFESAKRHLITLRYFSNIHDKINERLFEFGHSD